MKRPAVIFIIICTLFMSACDTALNSGGNPHVPPVDEPSPEFSPEFWGEWIRMDTGDAWYITSNAIKVNNQSFSTNAALVKQSGRVIEVSDGSRRYYLYASRPATSNFSGRITGDVSPSRTVNRAVGSGLGGITVIISNLNDKTKETTVATDDEGNFTANDVIAGDEYEVNAGDQTTVVLPNANGDDVGTITVTRGVNFKTSVKPKASSTDMTRLYANLFSYELTIEIENTGTVDCTAAVYTLELGSGLVLNAGSLTGILGTIEPRRKRVIDLTLACDAIQSEYEFKKIAITIDDPISGKSWDDSVSIKFNKVPVDFNVRSNRAVSGVIIAPNARAYSFKTSYSVNSVYSASLSVPWSAQDYLVVFSGATADTETTYSLGINTLPDTNFTDFLDVARYADHNTEDSAAEIVMQDKIMSYLYKNAIQYFKINLGDSAPEYRPASITDYAVKVVSGSNDAQVYPGESHYLDIRLKNNASSAITITSAVLSTASDYGDYVTIDNDTATIGNLNAGYYKTLTSSLGYASAASLLSSTYLSRAFKFAIAADCPAGTQIPFTVTFTGSLGNVWTDTLTIPVMTPDVDIVINNYSIREAANGNDDGIANPHETLYLDIRVWNSGANKAFGLQAVAVLETTSDYVTLDNDTASIGDLNGGYYKTLTDSSGAGKSSASSASLLYYNYLSNAFKFTIDGNCPIGEQLPFTITFTDSLGNNYTVAVTITVKATGANIIINTPKAENYAVEREKTPFNNNSYYCLDIRVKNSGTSKAMGVQAALSTTSDYVMLGTWGGVTTSLGDVNAGYYKTLTESSVSGRTSASTAYLLDNAGYSLGALRFTVAGDCPPSEQLPFAITFTDSWGNVWNESLTIAVDTIRANIAINTPKDENYALSENPYTYNGEPVQVKPGKYYYLDIRMKNSGKIEAEGLQAVLSTTSDYVGIDRGIHTQVGKLSAGSYKVLTDFSYSGELLMLNAPLFGGLKSLAFTFTVAPDCPAGEQLPFTITFTDSFGDVWTDTLVIPVE